jgi:hypothetical protein
MLRLPLSPMGLAFPGPAGNDAKAEGDGGITGGISRDSCSDVRALYNRCKRDLGLRLRPRMWETYLCGQNRSVGWRDSRVESSSFLEQTRHLHIERFHRRIKASDDIVGYALKRKLML